MKTTDELAHEISRSDNILDYYTKSRSEMHLCALTKNFDT